MSIMQDMKRNLKAICSETEYKAIDEKYWDLYVNNKPYDAIILIEDHHRALCPEQHPAGLWRSTDTRTTDFANMRKPTTLAFENNPTTLTSENSLYK